MKLVVTIFFVSFIIVSFVRGHTANVSVEKNILKGLNTFKIEKIRHLN
ncbi:MAG: hypothetical protein HRT43_02745 [Campylobacteraceae bacterium]|nr:hypothetical protein [Campylobacteraceae bacterium]